MTIHVLCLNPAVDRFYALNGFRAGEVYTGQTPSLGAGGKGVNVARTLAELGARPRLYAFLAETGGERIRKEMSALCDCLFLPVPGACRETVNILDRAAGRETVLSEAGPRVHSEHIRALLLALEDAVCPGDLVCCSGSAPAGAPPDVYAQIARLCAGLGARCALDCNAAQLAPSLTGAHYALGKPNAAELASLTGSAPPKTPEAAARMVGALLPTAYDALLVSLGGEGGVYAGPDGAFAASVPRAAGGFTVGCGDACFAGALLARSRGMDGAGTLRLAMACGAAKANGCASAGAVEKMFARVAVRAL